MNLIVTKMNVTLKIKKNFYKFWYVKVKDQIVNYIDFLTKKITVTKRQDTNWGQMDKKNNSKLIDIS